MNAKDQNGSIASVATIMLLALGLLGALVFAFWAFGQRQNFKDNSDKISAAAVSVALANQKTELQKQFDEQSKQPYKTFTGPSTYGTVSFNYPKTWSAYVDQSVATEPINGYFYPDVVPGIQSTTAFALRVELVSTTYDQMLAQFTAKIKTGAVMATAYLPTKLTGVKNAQPGTLLNGPITPTLSGTILVIKVRDKTLQISTQSKDYAKDFTDTVLPSLTFVP